MADEKAQGDQPAAPEKGRSPLVLVGGAVLLVLVGVGAGVGVAMALRDEPAAGAEAAATEGEAPAAEAEADADAPKPEQHYFSLDPAFVVNLQGGKRARYLKVELDAVTASEEVMDEVKKHMPALRNALVMLYSAQDYQALMTPEGKEQLRQQTLAALQEQLRERTGKPGIDDVFFSSFVLQ